MRLKTLRENVAALLVAAYEADTPQERARLNNLAAKARITGDIQEPYRNAVGYSGRHGWYPPEGIHTMIVVSPFTFHMEGDDLDHYQQLISDRRTA